MVPVAEDLREATEEESRLALPHGFEDSGLGQAPLVQPSAEAGVWQWRGVYGEAGT